MKISSLHIRDFRTIESLDLALPAAYTAVCGPNDSGKTNLIRALRAVMREDEGPIYVEEDEQISPKEDYPKWKDTAPDQRIIEVGLSLVLDSNRDAGLFQFVTRQLELKEPATPLELSIVLSYAADPAAPTATVTANGKEFVGLEAQEVRKRLQTSRAVLFHNSVQPEPRYRFRGGFGHLREFTGERAALLERMKKQVDSGLKRIARGQQQEFAKLLGRLEKKYKVGLSVPGFDLNWLPYNITLGESKYEVPLDNWGSGTQNRTLILLTLFRAKQIGDDQPSASKVTPLIIIEEPESFLHPSAQSEFGRVLQDLAAEFDVQVLVTTHSPYLLSLSSPDSNVLLSRRSHYGALRETIRVATEGGSWMEPFGQALGLAAEEFEPWRDLFRSASKAVLLVEGEIDKAYLELLRHEAHGKNRLDFDGPIIPYDGIGSLQNTVLLRFVKNSHKHFFITFDLDCHHLVERQLKSLNLEKGSHYLPIGVDAPGKKNIEGLLPETVRTAVYAAHADLVQAALSGTPEEKKGAQSKLKTLLLEEFTKQATPGEEYYKGFYALVRVANRALRA